LPALLQSELVADENCRGKPAVSIKIGAFVMFPEPAGNEGEQQLVNVLKTLSSPLTAAAL